MHKTPLRPLLYVAVKWSFRARIFFLWKITVLTLFNSIITHSLARSSNLDLLQKSSNFQLKNCYSIHSRDPLCSHIRQDKWNAVEKNKNFLFYILGLRTSIFVSNVFSSHTHGWIRGNTGGKPTTWNVSRANEMGMEFHFQIGVLDVEWKMNNIHTGIV